VVEDLDLEALELAVRKQVLQLAGAAVEQRLNADTRDERGSRTRCGQEARLVGRRSKLVHSVLGPLQLQRAYYHCSRCGHGFCPRDEHLGIATTSLSPALTRMVSRPTSLTLSEFSYRTSQPQTPVHIFRRHMRNHRHNPRPHFFRECTHGFLDLDSGSLHYFASLNTAWKWRSFCL
jgi:hypothetical protein